MNEEKVGLSASLVPKLILIVVDCSLAEIFIHSSNRLK